MSFWATPSVPHEGLQVTRHSAESVWHVDTEIRSSIATRRPDRDGICLGFSAQPRDATALLARTPGQPRGVNLIVWQLIRDNFRQLGAANTLLYAADRMLRAMTGGRARLIRYLLVAQPVPVEQQGRLRSSAGSRVREVASSDLVAAHFPRPPAVVAQRFATGSVCYVAEIRDRFAGFLWLAFNGYDEDEVRCRYEFTEPETSVWDYDVYVDPQFRLGRTFGRLWDTANRRLSADGVRWSFSRISAFNTESLAAHRRMGMRTLFTATFVCLGPVQLTLAGAAPFVHLGWSEGSRPVIRLHPGSGQ